MSNLIFTDIVEGEQILFQPKDKQVTYVKKIAYVPKPDIYHNTRLWNDLKKKPYGQFALINVTPKTIVFRADGKTRRVNREKTKYGIEYITYIFRGYRKYLRPLEGSLIVTHEEKNTKSNYEDRFIILDEINFFNDEDVRDLICV
jgi:hypothetical protein